MPTIDVFILPPAPSYVVDEKRSIFAVMGFGGIQIVPFEPEVIFFSLPPN